MNEPSIWSMNTVCYYHLILMNLVTKEGGLFKQIVYVYSVVCA